MSAPAPDAEVKPDSPDDLTARSWKYVLRKTAREFGKDQCTDNAAALTYYAVLALFPGLIALLSLVGLVGQGDQAARTVLEVLRDTGVGSVADTLEPTLLELSSGPGAGLALATGLAAALWSASGYVGSFGRAMNRIHEVTEGRPFWKLRPWMLVVTLVEVVLAAAVLTALVVTGPAAEAVGAQVAGPHRQPVAEQHPEAAAQEHGHDVDQGAGAGEQGCLREGWWGCGPAR